MKVKDEVRKILSSAVEKTASDIYFFTEEKTVVVKFKVQGKTVVNNELSSESGQEIINFFKFQARMDIAEHRRPQVGSMIYLIDGEKYYLRFSSVGDFLGHESLVVRIIYQHQNGNYFFPETFDHLIELCRNRGLILTSGPTGSGKTTLMYELARKFGHHQIVMCIEDPIEIKEPQFFQAQVNLGAQITYESLLKAALRHRPDILIIGEIRDSATAKLAVQASLSGHLVLATVHATSTYGTISRMLELGITENQLLNSLNAVCYQRLLINRRHETKCLIDVSDHTELEPVIENPRQGFLSWQKNLDLLEENNEISASEKQKFQFG